MSRMVVKKRKIKTKKINTYYVEIDTGKILEKFVDNKNTCDVVFHVTDDVNNDPVLIYALKELLLDYDYFKSMFSHFSESITNGPIIIKDKDPESFRNIMRFITTGKIMIDDKNIVSLYNNSKFYNLELLTDNCIIALDSMNSDSINNIMFNILKTRAYLTSLTASINEFELHDNFVRNIVQSMLTASKSKIEKRNDIYKYLDENEDSDDGESENDSDCSEDQKCECLDCKPDWNNCVINDELWYNIPEEMACLCMRIFKTNNETLIYKYMKGYASHNSTNFTNDINKKKYQYIIDILKYNVKLPFLSAKYIYGSVRQDGFYSVEELFDAMTYQVDPKIFKKKENKEYQFEHRYIYI